MLRKLNRRELLIGVASLVCAPSILRADGSLSMMGVGSTGGAVAGFQGVADIVASPLLYWGLRAMSAAKAAALVNCIDIIDVTGANTATLAVQSDGNLNVTTIASGSGAGGTLAAWVVAHGTAFIHKFYDQTVNGFDATYSITTGPELDMTLYGGKGAAKFLAGKMNSAGSMTQAQPFSVSSVSKRTGATVANDGIIGSAGNSMLLSYNSTANNLDINLASSDQAISGATEGIGHAVQWICQGATSIVNVDGADNTPAGNPGTATITAEKIAMADRAGGSLVGDIAELAMWAGATSAGNYGAIQVNQKAWWGTP